ncbi:MAG: cytochrome P450, partial [Gelidibacter sp.]
MSTHKEIPSVPLIRFLKHSLEILKNPLPFHHENFIVKGDTFKLKFGFSTEIVFSRDAAFAEYVLQKNHKNYTKSKIQTEDLVKYVGKGLLTAEGELWKKQRQLIQPAFHKKQLANLLGKMREAILSEYRHIEVGKTMDMFPVFNDLAFQTVVKSLFSSAASAEDISRLQFITESAQKMLVKELRQPYLGWWFNASGNIEKHLVLTQEARQILRNIVQVRRESEERHHDLLDMLLEAHYDDGSSMDEEQLIDEILILFTAGHETTSNALSFIFQLLAQHPEWQEKIHDELITNTINSKDLMHLVNTSKVCQQVIEEAMRLFPPVYFIDRVNVEEDEFKDMIFKKGSNLLLSIYEIHRHPQLWERPNEFLPERFEDGSRK